jgi:hypothetical protein
MELQGFPAVEWQGHSSTHRVGSMLDEARPNNFERSDADPRLIRALALGVAVFLAGTPFLLLAIYPRANHVGRIPNERTQPPEPRLQVAPKVDLDRLRATENSQLTTFGWIDRDKQVVRIPIGQAMKLIEGRGLRGWATPTPQPTDQAPR